MIGLEELARIINLYILIKVVKGVWNIGGDISLKNRNSKVAI